MDELAARLDRLEREVEELKRGAAEDRQTVKRKVSGLMEDLASLRHGQQALIEGQINPR